MVEKIKVGNRYIGEGEPVFIAAEISCNHLQKKDYALKLIEEAKAAGADGVKFQTYTPDTITADIDNEYFRIKGTLWEGKTLYELYNEAYTPWEWFPELKDKADEEGLIFFSSPFDETSVDLLEKLDCPIYKIASFEINHIPLLRYIASKKKPIILSTGVSTLEDIELALKSIREEGLEEIAVLKCTSAYPAPVNEMNLATIKDIKERFDVVPGLSDHTINIMVTVVAVSMGAKIIEKHFMLDRKAGGPDAEFSLEPAEFKNMVKAVRDTEQMEPNELKEKIKSLGEVEQAIGKVNYELTEKVKNHKFFMRSIFVVKDMKEGEIFSRDNIRVIRPNKGMHPKYYSGILGKKAKKNIEKGTPLESNMVEE